MPRITVVGSINLDLVAHAPSLPRPGETVTDATFERHPGGKGANQALAARRMGADVTLIACVGDDLHAAEATRLLREDGVDLTRCTALAGVSTGVALIVVAPDGENQIVVAPGANRSLRPEHVEVSDADVVVCQLEIPVPVVGEAMRQAAFGVLNCAPARHLPDELLAGSDVIVVNEGERAFYGRSLDDHPLVVTTLGPDGVAVMERGVERLRVPSIRVDAIDAVGAGDTFVGALAAELAAGSQLEGALRMAAAAGALATTVRGAQPSIPRRHAVLEAVAA